MEQKIGSIIRQKMIFRTKSVDEENFIIRGVFSTGAEDRDGEIIDQNGWDLDQFMENPVILFAHDHYQPAVGKAIELAKDGNGNLVGAIQFAAKEYEFAMTLFKLYAAGFMRAFSVGFMNKLYEIDQENDRVILRENMLYEISCVNVPANAMALAFSKGIDTSPLIKFFDKKDKHEKQEANAEIKEDKTPEGEEPKNDAIQEATEVIAKSNQETIRSVIRALTEALKAVTEADSKVGSKVEHPSKEGGNKKIPVTILNRAVKELLGVKKSQDK
jgi:HK97 family phage prohead protease